LSKGERNQPAARTERSAGGKIEAVEICIAGSGNVSGTYLSVPKGEGVVVADPDREWFVVLVIDAAVI
jgi:hypothetical protein